MSKLELAVDSLHSIDREAALRAGRDTLHPAARLLVTLGYILFVMSFDKYDFFGLLSMVLYPVFIAAAEDFPLGRALSRFGLIWIPLVCIGIANPFFDRTPVLAAGSLVITGGWISFVTLLLKGLFAVCATAFLVYSIGIEGVCSALRAMHVPPAACTVLLLIWRYIIVFLNEARRMMQAYSLRAPNQRGIKMQHWGSFAGHILLRSIDRANDVYHSMLLRGYTGVMPPAPHTCSIGKSIAYTCCWLTVFALLRTVPVFVLAGSLIRFF